MTIVLIYNFICKQLIRITYDTSKKNDEQFLFVERNEIEELNEINAKVINKLRGLKLM